MGTDNTIEATQLLEAYAKNPYKKGMLSEYTVRYEEGNPSCGDGLSVYLLIDDKIIVDYSWNGDAKVVATASASLLGEYIIKESTQTVMLRDYDTVVNRGLSVSEKRKSSAVLPLLAVRNAIHRWRNDQIIEDFEDILGR